MWIGNKIPVQRRGLFPKASGSPRPGLGGTAADWFSGRRCKIPGERNLLRASLLSPSSILQPYPSRAFIIHSCCVCLSLLPRPSLPSRGHRTSFDLGVFVQACHGLGVLFLPTWPKVTFLSPVQLKPLLPRAPWLFEFVLISRYPES